MIYKDLIKNKAVLILFYDHLLLVDEPIAELRDLAAYFGKDVDIIKIRRSQNTELTEALKIKSDLVYLIYSKEMLKHRLEEKQSLETLKQLLSELIKP